MTVSRAKRRQSGQRANESERKKGGGGEREGDRGENKWLNVAIRFDVMHVRAMCIKTM